MSWLEEEVEMKRNVLSTIQHILSRTNSENSGAVSESGGEEELSNNPLCCCLSNCSKSALSLKANSENEGFF